MAEVCEEARQGRMLSLPERIFQRPDLALVATGSLSCIRSLYQEAVRLDKTHQFFPCIQPAQAYAAGMQGKALVQTLHRVLSVPGVGGIILYASCADVLSKTDFPGIIAGLDNPASVPIHVLLRGPMVNRYARPREALEKILAETPLSGGEIPRKKWSFPPPRPDFYYVSSALQYMNAMPVLLTAGGCGGDPESDSGGLPEYRLGHTRFNDIQASLGAEPIAAACAAAEAQEQGRPGSTVCLLGSAVPTFLGMDRERIAREVATKGWEVRNLGCDGFTPGPAGLAQALETMLQYQTAGAPQPGRVDILGYCGAVLGDAEKLAHGMEHLRKCGFQPGFFGQPDRMSGNAQLNWVVSAAGLPLAERMQRERGIPYVAGIPVGAHQMRQWRQRINEIMGHAEVLPPEAPAEQPLLPGKRALLVGEPLLTACIGDYLRQSLGCKEVLLGVYAPVVSLQQFYRRVCPDLPLCFFAHPEEFRALSRDADWILADPEFDLGEHPMTYLPDPQVSGARYQQIPYSIFGKKGAAWIAENIKAIFKGETT